MTDKKGFMGNIYNIGVAHQELVGETRKHNPDPDSCWCWVDGIHRAPTPNISEVDSNE